MPQTFVWTGRALRPEAVAVLEGLASISISVVGERNDWCAEAANADVTMEVMACEQIASILRGERPTNLVNAHVWGRQRN